MRQDEQAKLVAEIVTPLLSKHGLPDGGLILAALGDVMTRLSQLPTHLRPVAGQELIRWLTHIEELAEKESKEST